MLYDGFGVKILYTNESGNRTAEEKYLAKRVSLDALLKRADIVSLHVPLTKETRHLIGKRELRAMKPSAFLINTSRGPVVDEAALIEVLEGNVIAGAALDVFEHEPKIPRALRQLQNVVLTPHTASATVKVRETMSRRAAENLLGRGGVNHEQTFDTGAQGLRFGAPLARELLRQARGLKQAGQRQGTVTQGSIHGQV